MAFSCVPCIKLRPLEDVLLSHDYFGLFIPDLDVPVQCSARSVGEHLTKGTASTVIFDLYYGQFLLHLPECSAFACPDKTYRLNVSSG